MPAKHTVKIYVQDGIYHVYNRGVEKRTIFEDDQDYKVFLNCLKWALVSPDELIRAPVRINLQGTTLQNIPRTPKSFYESIDLLAYCLMPNHFHLLVKQKHERSLDGFMRSIATRYAMYFNRKRKRVGSLFQGIYRAILVDTDMYLLHVSRYIHRNPSEMSLDLVSWYSSYAEYLGIRHTSWVQPQLILSSFQPGNLPFLRRINTYKQFVESETKNTDISEEEFQFDF